MTDSEGLKPLKTEGDAPEAERAFGCLQQVEGTWELVHPQVGWGMFFREEEESMVGSEDAGEGRYPHVNAGRAARKE